MILAMPRRALASAFVAMTARRNKLLGDPVGQHVGDFGGFETR
jgi:hypothetical protein